MKTDTHAYNAHRHAPQHGVFISKVVFRRAHLLSIVVVVQKHDCLLCISPTLLVRHSLLPNHLCNHETVRSRSYYTLRFRRSQLRSHPAEKAADPLPLPTSEIQSQCQCQSTKTAFDEHECTFALHTRTCACAKPRMHVHVVSH